MSPNDVSCSPGQDDRLVFFFDTSPPISTLLLKLISVHLDNCLYPKSTRIHDMMSTNIHQYFIKHLNLTDEEAASLHQDYYRSYGLALEGLVRHHRIGFLFSPGGLHVD